MTFCNCVMSLESRDPEIGRGLPNASANVKNKQTNDVSIFYIQIVFCAKYIHPAGDVLWVFVEPGNVVPQISVAGHRCWLSRAKNRLKNAKNPLSLVLFRESFMSGA